MGNGNHRTPFIENGYYHIYNRGYNKTQIYKDKSCFNHFYKLMVNYLEYYKSDFKIISYSLLPNHFHFIIHNTGCTGTLKISDFMKKLQGAYSVWHRVKYPLGTGTKLPFFEGRFKAKLIQDQEYLERCLAYVNFNPLKHEIVKSIDDYERTSYHQLANKDKINQYRDLVLDELEI
ncbi:MAG: transposase [Candidatus Gracilibacteria bacterium]